MSESSRRPEDWEVRQRALDPAGSFIVQAPAGSGKTELLIQRILVLLARSQAPEEVLAITFTRKAAGEMKARLIEALQKANDDAPAEEHEKATWSLARQVLQRDLELGWHLSDNANRLQIMTIDSFCTNLTRRMPWLSRFGAQPETTDDPSELYQIAAERLLEQVEVRGPGSQAARRLLGHLDNRLNVLRDMLVEMLGRRDQWLRHLLGTTDARPVLEEGLQVYLLSSLNEAYTALGPQLRDELNALCCYAIANLDPDDSAELALFRSWHGFPAATLDDWPQWQAMLSLLVNSQGRIRSSVNRNQGFPPGDDHAKEMKRRMHQLLEALAANPHLETAILQLCNLPLPHYLKMEWAALEALIQLLPLQVVELQKVFREKGRVDFIEVAGAARAALGDSASPEDLLLQCDRRINHILIDEFQDTSHGQYVLLQLLTAGWQPDDGRTLFVVGDPMQSIYRFREADVGLYLRIRRLGLENVELQPLTLSVNFRSQQGLVDWVNQTFIRLFPQDADEYRGAVPYSPATAVKPADEDQAVTITAFAERQDQHEAMQVVDLVRQAQAERPGRSVAVLVRSRTHLAEIVAGFKAAGLKYQAQDVDPLSDRPVIQDLRALTCALLHLGDRVSWLSILRAPWCGLMLDDLLALCGQDASQTVWSQLNRSGVQTELFNQLSHDSQIRLDRFLQVMGQALQWRGRMPLRRLLETTWLNLGGPACVDSADLEDARQFFQLLEDLDQGGELRRLESLDERLQRLYSAPDVTAGPELQIMTVHKAKGLEFDTVILPGIGRGVSSHRKTLLRWQELPDNHLLLAPVPASVGQGDGQTYKALGTLMTEKDHLESMRVFYVATTRAKSRLHLLGHVRPKKDGDWSAESGSFLSRLWPCVADSVTVLPALAQGCDETVALCPPQSNSRLPADWALPDNAPACPGLLGTRRIDHEATSAPEVGHGTGLALSLRNEEARLVGEVVHGWLETFAGEGLEHWSVERLDALSGPVRTQLGQLGLPGHRLDSCAKRVVSALQNCLTSERCQWLLASHQDGASELALSACLDGELVEFRIDRTFKADNERWIVDYKTAEPGKEGVESFYRQMAETHREQLENYARLFRFLEPGMSIRMAIYYPMFDGWYEFQKIWP